MAVRGKSNVTDMGTRADVMPQDVQRDEALALPAPDERRYSLNALIAAGIIGFVAGRVFGR